MHHSPVMGLHVTSISALPLTVAVGRTSRGPSPCQCQCPDGPLPTTAFSRGFLRLECKSKGMVMELEICCIAPSARAASPFSHPWCSDTTLPSLAVSNLSVPVWSSSLFMEVAELRLNLYILVVSLFSSSSLVVEVLFPKVLSGCCSLGKMQVLFSGITAFSLSWKSNKIKYLFIIFPTARSQLDTCDSSLCPFFFFQCVSISSVCHLSYLIAKKDSNGLRFHSYL